MSIPIEFINLIIRKSTLETKYKGGLEQFIKDIPNQSFRKDAKLVRFGCMNNSDLESFIDLILERGLEYKEKDTDDFVIINSYSGISWRVSWLEHDYIECWMVNQIEYFFKSTSRKIMKKYPITLLIILSITMTGCRKSNDEKAKDAIKSYLNENLDDMSTYEPVKFGNLDSLKELDLTSTSLENSKDSSLYFEMFHSYRIKGVDGAKYLTKEYFILNSKIEVINKQPYSSKPFQLPELPANWLVPEDTAAVQ